MNSDITIPTTLLPTDGRFGSGPTKVRSQSVEALESNAIHYLGTSHRQTTVRRVVERIQQGLGELFGLPDDYEVLLGLGGTTAFWDAAVFGLIRQRSAHHVFGEFSSKFAAAVSIADHLAEPVLVEAELGTAPQNRAVPGVDLYALTHNETSTGVVVPVIRPQADALVVVDATSAAGAIAVDPREFDVYYFSPQKAFGSEGGLWFALCSPSAVERIEEIAASDRYQPPFLDLGIALDNSRKHQTYNTPALATLFLAGDQIDWFNDQGGMNWSVGRSAANARLLYEWVDSQAFAAPFVQPIENRSPVTATIDFEVDAARLAAVLRSNGIVDVEPYRKLGRNQLRIGLWPSIDLDDVQALTNCIDYVVDRM